MYPSQQKKYSSEELQAFEAMIVLKLEKANDELKNTLEVLGRKKENSTDKNIKMLEDSAEVAEQESLGQLAARQRKFIAELEAAFLRIKNGTYGVCMVTGELIDKERLKVVPHTRHSLAAKLSDTLVVR
ncbi:MAG: TraR/DksA C4-type zinc finger protein [Amoebophilaceae bacterium]|nr:TraR/DksA C4-type zinc finger protein [Amoebophilaceae bacterium]